MAALAGGNNLCFVRVPFIRLLITWILHLVKKLLQKHDMRSFREAEEHHLATASEVLIRHTKEVNLQMYTSTFTHLRPASALHTLEIASPMALHTEEMQSPIAEQHVPMAEQHGSMMFSQNQPQQSPMAEHIAPKHFPIALQHGSKMFLQIQPQQPPMAENMAPQHFPIAEQHGSRTFL